MNGIKQMDKRNKWTIGMNGLMDERMEKWNEQSYGMDGWIKLIDGSLVGLLIG